MNISKCTHMIEAIHNILQQEVQYDVRIAALKALLSIEETTYNQELVLQAMEKQFDKMEK